MKCAICLNNMSWVGDHEVEDDVYYSMWVCRDCSVESINYFGDEVDRANEQGGFL